MITRKRYKYITCLVPFLLLCGFCQGRRNIVRALERQTKVHNLRSNVKLYHDTRIISYFLVSKYLKLQVINMQYILCSTET